MRTAFTPSRIARIYKRQTTSLSAKRVKNPIVYVDELHTVQRISKRASTLIAVALERHLADVCKELKRNAQHAGRKTVKREDFELFVETQRADINA